MFDYNTVKLTLDDVPFYVFKRATFRATAHAMLRHKTFAFFYLATHHLHGKLILARVVYFKMDILKFGNFNLEIIIYDFFLTLPYL